ncbi:MAG: hypothetical protein GY866_05650 [Proteobacteria bacterium]|nr:hypothetical protein [Pseudomonadota bacterium]
MEKKINKQINERLKKAIHAVIDQQIAESDPPETLETFERLQDEGFTSEEAYALIGHLVSMEIAEEIGGKEGLNVQRYITALEKLPAPFAKARKNFEDDD